MANYNLSEFAKTLTWAEWMRQGGCNLSDVSAVDVLKRLNLYEWQRKGYLTLGEVAEASLLANRELARHAIKGLFKHDLVVVETIGQDTSLEGGRV